jgi:WD40 repeat protein
MNTKSMEARLSLLEKENADLTEVIKALRLHFLIDDSTFDQIMVTSRRTEAHHPKYRKRGMNDIPNELIVHICSYVDSKSLSLFGMTCQLYKLIISHDDIWSERYLWKWGPNKLSRARDKKLAPDVKQKDWKSQFNQSEMSDLRMKQGRASVTLYDGHVGTVTCLEILPGNRIISGSDDGSMLLWSKCMSVDSDDAGPIPPALALAELALGKKRLDPHRTKVYPNIASGSYNIAGRIYHRKKSAQQLCKSRTFFGHGGPIWCVAFNGETEQLLSGGYDETVKVWSLLTGNCTSTLRGHSGWVSSLVLLPSNGSSSMSHLASASWDNTLRVWSLSGGGELVRTLQAGQDSGALLSLSGNPQGGSVAVGCCNAQIQLWDIEAGQLHGSLLGHTKEVHAVRTTSTGGCVISGSGDCSIKIWDKNKCVGTLSEHTGSVMTLQVCV